MLLLFVLKTRYKIKTIEYIWPITPHIGVPISKISSVNIFLVQRHITNHTDIISGIYGLQYNILLMIGNILTFLRPKISEMSHLKYLE